MICFKKFILLLVFAVLFTAIAAGCGGEADKNGDSKAPSTSTEQEGAETPDKENDSLDENGGNWTVVVPGRK